MEQEDTQPAEAAGDDQGREAGTKPTSILYVRPNWPVPVTQEIWAASQIDYLSRLDAAPHPGLAIFPSTPTLLRDVDSQEWWWLNHEVLGAYQGLLSPEDKVPVRILHERAENWLPLKYLLFAHAILGPQLIEASRKVRLDAVQNPAARGAILALFEDTYCAFWVHARRYRDLLRGLDNET